MPDERVWRLRLARQGDDGERFVFALKDQGWGVADLTEDEELFGIELVAKSSLTTERHRTQVAEGERDEQKRINEFDIGVANAELREDLERVERERDELEQNQRGSDEVVIHESRYAELKRAEREVERLREALEVIAYAASKFKHTGQAPLWEDVESNARSALAASQEET